jgi:hypothetical protein
MSIKIGDFVAIQSEEFSCGYRVGVVYSKRKLDNRAHSDVEIAEDFMYGVEWVNVGYDDDWQRAEYTYKNVAHWRQIARKIKL